MSVVIFLNKNDELEATADRYAYDHVDKKMVLYEKLFNLHNRYIIGFSSEGMTESTVEHYRLMLEPLARDIIKLDEFVEVMRANIFHENTYFRRPDQVLIGGFDKVPLIFRLTRANNYTVEQVRDDHTFIGWDENLETVYQDKKDSSEDVAIALLQDRCDRRPDLIRGIPKRYIVDTNGVREVILTRELKPMNTIKPGKKLSK